MQVYDRAQGEMVQAPEVGKGAMHFVYETACGRLLAKGILCRHFISKLYGAWQSSALSRRKARRFMQRYAIDVSDCTQQTFPNFNAFFTRQRRQYTDRTRTGELPAVADSKLTALSVDAQTRFCVKDVPYTLAELLENDMLAEQYAGGMCLIFRLSPEDYHRYVYPDNGTQEQTVAIPGVLHSVNPIAGSQRVYRRNARRYTVLHTEQFGDVIEMEVGALLVGKICNHREAPCGFSKLQEKGYFAYGGSTVIVLLQAGRVAVDTDILNYSAQGIECRVRLGEKIGVACAKEEG